MNRFIRLSTSDVLRNLWLMNHMAYGQSAVRPKIPQPLGFIDAISQKESGLTVTAVAASQLREILVGARKIKNTATAANIRALKIFIRRTLKDPSLPTKRCITRRNPDS